tara:strand:+ start:1625 stop:1726 length:102 start_codon:yes stop_codon:yes gene_type:complete
MIRKSKSFSRAKDEGVIRDDPWSVVGAALAACR